MTRPSLRRFFFPWVALALMPIPVLSGPLPRHASDLLLIGDSVTAGVYFLQLDQESMSQAWSGQLLQRLGIDVPKAPYENPFPINHRDLATGGFGRFGLGYAWEGRRFFKGHPKFELEDERVVLAVPGQTVREALEQSSDTDALNDGSVGWTFGNILLPKHMSVIETVESWQKRPRWIVVFIGANDLLSSFGMVGRATPVTPDAFHRDYAELTGRLRAKMAPDTPASQLIVLTLPDVTRLPLLQPVPAGSVDRSGAPLPGGARASAFLLPYRNRLDDDEVWTAEDLTQVQQTTVQYNDAIRKIASSGGFTVLDINALMAHLADDPAFSAPESPYFSPDLHHPSFRTHEAIASAVLDTMASVAGEPAPSIRVAVANPLPSAHEFEGEARHRMNAMMHLAVQGLEMGPLPPRLTSRMSVESAGQGGDERVGEVVFSVAAAIELAPFPVTAHTVARPGIGARATLAALHTSGDEPDFFPKRSPEARAGAAFEPIGGWTWQRLELGTLLTLDRYHDFGYFVRGEWRILYADVSSRGWEPDRFEIGIRFGMQPGRPGRNGN